MPEQLAFRLPARTATGRADFFVSEANAGALARIDGWRDWPEGKLVLIGPEGAGKSHLARVWASESGARILDARALADWEPDDLSAELSGNRPKNWPGNWVVEDVPAIAGEAALESTLFHLHNLVLAEGGRLLLTGNAPPSRWNLTLPDLASRMQGADLAKLAPPDDALLAAILRKLFADRQIAPSPHLIPWLLARMDRSFAAAGRIVAALDDRGLATGRPIGRQMAREVLRDLLDEDGEAGP